MSSLQDWGSGGKGDNAHETINTGPPLPPKKSILSLKKKKYGLSFPPQENEDNASVAPISKSASDAT